MTGRRIGRTGWAVTIALTAFAGCGDDGPSGRGTSTASGTVDPVALQAIVRASQKLADAGSSTFTMSGSFPIEDEGIPVTASGTMSTHGVPAATMSMTIELPDADERLKIEARMLGSRIYSRMPAAYAPDPDRPWIASRIPATAIQSSDPSFQLRMLRYADEAQPVGHERVNGHPTTRYRVSIDYAKLARTGPKALQGVAKAQLHEDPRARLSSDVWIDDRGVVRRTTCTMIDPEHPAKPQKVTTEILKLGGPIRVQAPPIDQVMDESEAQEIDPA